jgi:hypothetical protein
VKLFDALRVPSVAVIDPLPRTDPAANEVENVPLHPTVAVFVAFKVPPR